MVDLPFNINQVCSESFEHIFLFQGAFEVIIINIWLNV